MPARHAGIQNFRHSAHPQSHGSRHVLMVVLMVVVTVWLRTWVVSGTITALLLLVHLVFASITLSCYAHALSVFLVCFKLQLEITDASCIWVTWLTCAMRLCHMAIEWLIHSVPWLVYVCYVTHWRVRWYVWSWEVRYWLRWRCAAASETISALPLCTYQSEMALWSSGFVITPLPMTSAWSITV